MPALTELTDDQLRNMLAHRMTVYSVRVQVMQELHRRADKEHGVMSEVTGNADDDSEDGC
jgi:hypothetical protein